MDEKEKNDTLDEISESALWLRIVKNKYLIVTVFFIVWMAFFDNNNWVYLKRLTEEAGQKRTDRAWYKSEIEKVNAEYKNITTDLNTIERFGREQYYMKRSDEDVYIFLAEE
ncbi:MAG: septum formation initiator family protein [Flavobacteriales bacterium]|nr:septum formation initiator family protein [Chitinophagales bacterium]MCZ2442282.1 septum formation initiator family protein [Flavobacteriales bacterium]